LKKLSDRRGKPTTCKICKHQFRFKCKEDREKWESHKHICPKCKEKYCNKPETERVLMILQDDYFQKDRDVSVLDHISRIVISYAESLLKKRYSNYINNDEDVRYFADNAAHYLIMEFYNNPDYKVWGSWAGALNDKIRQALFCKDEKPLDVLLYERRKDIDEVYSINFNLEDGHELELEDEQYTGIKDVDDYMDKILFHDLLIKLIKGFQKHYSTQEVMFMVQGLVMKFDHDDDEIVNNFFDNFGKTGKWAYIKINELFKDQLKVLM
jgi:hypothetical protein